VLYDSADYLGAVGAVSEGFRAARRLRSQLGLRSRRVQQPPTMPLA